MDYKDLEHELRLLASGAAWQCAETAVTLEDAAAEIARLRAALEAIRDAAPWVGTNPEYGDGHDAAREAAADIARDALAPNLR